MRNIVAAITVVALGFSLAASAAEKAAPQKKEAPAMKAAAPAAAPAAAAPAAAAMPKMDKEKMMTHLKGHQKYPATKAEMMAACKDLMDFSAEEKKWFGDKLPEGSYKSADEVVKALGM